MSILDDAIAAHRSGDLIKAEELYDAATVERMDTFPVSATYHRMAKILHHRAILRAEIGSRSRAIEDLRGAVHLNPLPEYRLTLGKLLDETGDVDGAIEQYREALKSDLPESLRMNISTNLSNCMVKKGDCRRARMISEAACRCECDISAAAWNSWASAILADGDADAAIPLFQKAVSADMQNPDLHYNLANAFFSDGQHAKAIEPATVAIRLLPSHAKALGLRGQALLASGAAEAAEGDLRAAMEFDPKDTITATALGNLLSARGDNPGAEQCYRQSIACGAATAENFIDLGGILHRTARYAEAAQQYRTALKIAPDNSQIHCNLSNTLYEMGEFDESLKEIDEAVRIEPTNAAFHGNRGNALQNRKEYDEAIKAYKEAIRLNPEWGDPHNNLANVYHTTGRFEAAVTGYRLAIKLQPNYPAAIHNLANAFVMQGKVGEAIRYCKIALTLEPDFATAHWSLGLMLLMTGDYVNGWQEYDWRWRTKALKIGIGFGHPFWRGEDIAGKTLLVHAEQGFGDTIQMSRYIPMVVERTNSEGWKSIRREGQVIFACQPELISLFEAQNWPGVRIISAEKVGEVAFDLHCPIMSLPRIFGCTLENIPKADGWIKADEYDPMNGLIGVCWSGRPTHPQDSKRSMKREQFESLAYPGSFRRLIALQKGGCTEDMDWGIWAASGIASFFDVAKLISQCEVVVCVDTAVAHLAGAMGKPCIVLLPYAPDFRWGLHGTTTPWYKSISLARQISPGDWTVPLAMAAQWLDKLDKEQSK